VVTREIISFWNNFGKFSRAEIELFQTNVAEGWNSFEIIYFISHVTTALATTRLSFNRRWTTRERLYLSVLVFCSCDLDLDQMTLIYEFDPVCVLFIADPVLWRSGLSTYRYGLFGVWDRPPPLLHCWSGISSGLIGF